LGMYPASVLALSVTAYAVTPLPKGELSPKVTERASPSPQRLFFLHRNVLLIMVY
jgi:hypothetical protein